MKIILIGDPASGKSTFLKYLDTKKYHVHFEQLSEKLHVDIYHNLVLKNVNYALYFFERDYNIWTDDKPAFLEYCHYATYSFIKTHERVGKMTKKERETVDRVLDEVSTLMPLDKDDIVLHFTCDADTIRERLKERAPHMSTKEIDYITTLREELKNNFTKRCIYHHIDTSNLTSDDVCGKIKEILPWITYIQ